MYQHITIKHVPNRSVSDMKTDTPALLHIKRKREESQDLSVGYNRCICVVKRTRYKLMRVT